MSFPNVRVINPLTQPVPVMSAAAGTGKADVPITATTSGSLGVYTAFPSTPCTKLLVYNIGSSPSASLSVKIAPSSTPFSIPDGSGANIGVAANANEVSIAYITPQVTTITAIATK